MTITTLTVGPLAENCYLVGCERTQEGVVIDPGDEAETILEAIRREGLTIRYILNTHAHFDHVGAVRAVKEATGAPFLLHRGDLDLLEGAVDAAAFFGFLLEPPPGVNEFVEEGEVIPFGGEGLRVLYTPGHSPGGVSYCGAGVVFAGDALFAGSIGRTDLEGGSYPLLVASIREKLFPLGDEVVVYPGHGPATTIGEEQRTNPFVGEGVA